MPPDDLGKEDVDNAEVRRNPRDVAPLSRAEPPDVVVVLERTRYPRRDAGKPEPHHERVTRRGDRPKGPGHSDRRSVLADPAVVRSGKLGPELHVNTELLAQFPAKGVLGRLPLLHLPAGELPQSRHLRRGGSARGEKGAGQVKVVDDGGRHHKAARRGGHRGADDALGRVTP